MLLHIQFPMSDLRILANAQVERLKAPNWPTPLRDCEFMRSTGIVRDRPAGGLKGWIAEESYCEARHALTLDPYLTSAVLSRWRLRIAFRRFYFDGTAVAKFEIGFTNRHGGDAVVGNINDLLADLLAMPVRVSGTADGTRKCQLIDAGRLLAAAYARASSHRSASWRWLGGLIRKGDSNPYVVAGTPAMFLECAGAADLELPQPSRAIKTADSRLGLFLSRHKYQGRTVPVWTATHPDFAYPRPLYRLSRVRKLRLYLLRLNAENQTLVRVLKAIETEQINPAPRSPQSDLLQAYLTAATSNILGLSAKSREFAEGDEQLAMLAALAAECFLTAEERQSALKQLESMDIRKNIFRKVEQQPVASEPAPGALPPVIVINRQTGCINIGYWVMSKDLEKLIAVVFGAAFLIAMLVLAVVFTNPTAFQYTVFRIVLSVAAAGFVAMTPGFLDVKIGNWLRAGGALAVFAVVYFFSPASLVVNPS